MLAYFSVAVTRFLAKWIESFPTFLVGFDHRPVHLSHTDKCAAQDFTSLRQRTKSSDFMQFSD